jgi:hypothetical protein
MKIVPYVHRQAPELCYFTLNGIRFTEKPMLGKQVDWYKVMTSNRAKHPIAEIRAKHFAPFYHAKVVKLTVTFPIGFEYVNETKYGIFTTYKQLLIDIKKYMIKKHPSYHDHNMVLLSGAPMPVPTIKITTKQTYVRGNV